MELAFLTPPATLALANSPTDIGAAPLTPVSSTFDELTSTFTEESTPVGISPNNLRSQLQLDSIAFLSLDSCAYSLYSPFVIGKEALRASLLIFSHPLPSFQSSIRTFLFLGRPAYAYLPAVGNPYYIVFFPAATD
ncbi:hypothetical protein AMTR_s00139p00060190 [Amborella trichopoda]|uniref:Uncharacterized protein n=1 Tax=Amborella trichopoda TaxID=13333 RepID=W1NEP8_AMBTC|nr:hypothetical protein AMTR_s00139p00060190 [Amborella trichopoda]